MLAGALALSVTPILGFNGVAGAQEVADPIGEGNFCEDVPQTEPFTDVQPTDPSFGEIVCLVATEITEGTGDGTTYSPNNPTTRRQMALFLTRLANEANRLEVDDMINELPEPTDTEFSDTEDEEQFIEDAISQITEAGVAQGFPDGTYRPAAPVSRRQMAAFIDRLYEFLTGEALPDATEDHFADDNADSAEAQASTNRVAEAGIFIGNADGTFAPAANISRRQMANVMTRTLQVLFENGFITQWAAAEEEPTNNQAFTVDKTTTQVLADTADGPQVVEINFSGLTPGVEYDIYLVPCTYWDEGSQVFSNGQPFVGPNGESRHDGIISFNDDYGGTGNQPDDEADNFGFTENSELFITLVGSTPTGGTASAEDHVAPANGTLRVTIQGDGEIDCGIPVIVEDPAATDADSLLLKDSNEDTLENDDTPVRPFAVGPAVMVFDGVGENGDEPSDNIRVLAAASNFPGLLGSGDDIGVAFHDHGDSLFGVDFDVDNFFYEGSDFEGPITREQARAYLTLLDGLATCNGHSACNNIDTPYTTTGTNNWVIWQDELPANPTGVTGTVGNFDGDGTTVVDDVTVSWTAPSFGTGLGGDVDEYCVEIWDVNAADSGDYDNGCTDEVDSQQTGDAPTTLTCTASNCDLEDVAAGTYRARVQADSETDHSSGWSPWSEPFTVAGPPGPISTSATTTDADDSGTVTPADVLVVQFNSEMDNTPADDTVTLRDADGTTCTYTDATASTFAYSDTQAGVTGVDTLTITIGAPSTCTAAGTVGGLQYPATVVSSTNVKSAVGVAWDVANSTDVTFE